MRFFGLVEQNPETGPVQSRKQASTMKIFRKLLKWKYGRAIIVTIKSMNGSSTWLQSPRELPAGARQCEGTRERVRERNREGCRAAHAPRVTGKGSWQVQEKQGGTAIHVVLFRGGFFSW